MQRAASRLCRAVLATREAGARARLAGKFDGPDAYNSALVAALTEREVEVIAVTDHHAFDATAESLRRAAEDAGITVFPGFEYTTVDNIHYLCLFEPGTDRQTLDRALGCLGPPSEGRSCGTSAALHLPESVAAQHGVAIAAHIDRDNGLLQSLNGDATIAAWTTPELLAVAVSNRTLAGESPHPRHRNEQRQAHAEEQVRKINRILEDKEGAYRRSSRDPRSRFALPVLFADDINGPHDVLRPSATCWLKLGERSVHGLRCAFLEHGLRVALKAPSRNHGGAIVAVAWEGDGFLGGQYVRFSDDFTALIRARGSGKSVVLQSLRFALDLDLQLGEPDQRRFAKDAASQLEEVVGVGTQVHLPRFRKSSDCARTRPRRPRRSWARTSGWVDRRTRST